MPELNRLSLCDAVFGVNRLYRRYLGGCWVCYSLCPTGEQESGLWCDEETILWQRGESFTAWRDENTAEWFAENVRVLDFEQWTDAAPVV